LFVLCIIVFITVKVVCVWVILCWSKHCV
jgi:hypothetical protein